MRTYPLAPALKLWLDDRRIKPVIWDADGRALYLQGMCVECAIKGAERYVYEDDNRVTTCLDIRQIDAMSCPTLQPLGVIR